MVVILYLLQLVRPMCMVPNIPGIPGPPLGGSSSGSNSPSGYSIHSEAKMVSTRLALYFCLLISSFCLHVHPAASLCASLLDSSYDFLLQSLVYIISYTTSLYSSFCIIQSHLCFALLDCNCMPCGHYIFFVMNMKMLRVLFWQHLHTQTQRKLKTMIRIK